MVKTSKSKQKGFLVVGKTKGKISKKASQTGVRELNF